MYRTALRIAAAALAVAIALPAFAQQYPTRPIRAIVPFAAGSATDTVARVFADRMSQILGQPIVIDNRAGASGLLGADAAAKSAPDGYTILVGTNSTNAAAPALFRSVPYDMERDFAPISFLCSVPLVVAVPNTSPVRTLRELIDRARARPGETTFASASASQRVSTEMLATMAGIRMTHVPYRAGPQAMQDLVAGRVDVFTADFAVMLPQVRGNNVRALAITSRVRSPMVPDVPTVEEAGGLQGYELIAWFGMFAPAGTPPAIIQRLNAAVREAAASPEVRERLGTGMGMFIQPGTPEELAANVRSEAAKWARAVEAAGIERE